MNTTYTTRLIGFFFVILFGGCTQKETPEQERHKTISWNEYHKIPKPSLAYEEVHKPLEIENLQMLGQVTSHGVIGKEGQILRGLRFKNATNAVEARYNLPHNLVLAMLIHETSGMDLLPNGIGDGGFGICHMQGSAATRFGLKTYKGCTSLVCDGRNHPRGRGSCVVGGKTQNHAKDLYDLIKKERFVRFRLIEHDDRLHPILCLDAVGRMLAEGMDRPPTNDYLRSIGPLRRALYRYSGRKEYFEKVAENMRLLEDPVFLRNLEQRFNQMNPNLRINGKKADYKSYISLMNRDLENYGLREYRKLPKYKPVQSEVILETYRPFVFK